MCSWSAGEAHAALEAAPAVGLDALCPGAGAVVVVAPHPDDESLGCGGLIALACEAGREVVVAVLTDGAASHPQSRAVPPPALARLRAEEARRALHRLGAGAPVMFGAADGDLCAHVDRCAARLAGMLRARPGATVLAPWIADPHLDHKAAHAVAGRAARACGARRLSYPVWGLALPPEADAGPAGRWLALDIAPVLARKAAAIAEHRSQLEALIPDDPDAFRLTDADVARHLRPHEPYLLAAA